MQLESHRRSAGTGAYGGAGAGAACARGVRLRRRRYARIGVRRRGCRGPGYARAAAAGRTAACGANAWRRRVGGTRTAAGVGVAVARPAAVSRGAAGSGRVPNPALHADGRLSAARSIWPAASRATARDPLAEHPPSSAAARRDPWPSRACTSSSIAGGSRGRAGAATAAAACSSRCFDSIAITVGASNGSRAGEHLVEHAAERVDVGAAVDRLAADLLGRHVLRRAEHVAGLRHRVLRAAAVVAQLGDAEVEHA